MKEAFDVVTADGVGVGILWGGRILSFWHINRSKEDLKKLKWHILTFSLDWLATLKDLKNRLEPLRNYHFVHQK